jgi:hypothetical protein
MRNTQGLGYWSGFWLKSVLYQIFRKEIILECLYWILFRFFNLMYQSFVLLFSLSTDLVLKTFHLCYRCIHLHSLCLSLSLSHTHTHTQAHSYLHTVLCPIRVWVHFPCVEKVGREFFIFFTFHFWSSVPHWCIVLTCVFNRQVIQIRIGLVAFQGDTRYEVNRCTHAHTFTCALFKPCNHVG